MNGFSLHIEPPRRNKHLFCMTLNKHARIQKILSEGSNFDNVFFFQMMRGGRIEKTLSAGHHQPASETPFKWRFAGVLMMAQHRILAQ